MNCHGDNKDNKEKKDINKHSPLKHILHMVLCCGLPIVIIAILPFIAKFSPSGAGILGIIAPFICPVMMGVMMLTMFRGKKRSCCDTKNETHNNSKSLDLNKNIE